ncbi:MAG: hypothetical protein KJ749_15050 [Planctomycetes bacterium]|nr:hypothetical protein [Planctomycetota bacterium]
MGSSSIRRYDVRATYAAVLSCIAVVPFLAAAFLTWRNYNPDIAQIVYGAEGSFVPVFLACIAASGLPGFLGFVLGWSSAGQRRNDKPARSWMGFFVGGFVVTLDLILLIAFYMLKLKHVG